MFFKRKFLLFNLFIFITFISIQNIAFSIDNLDFSMNASNIEFLNMYSIKDSNNHDRKMISYLIDLSE